MKLNAQFVIFFLFSITIFAQVDSAKIKSIESLDFKKTSNFKVKNPIRAAAFSAVLPGVGQFYNKQYWKIPIVWGLLGVGTGFIIFNGQKRNEFRSAFIAELNGQPHKFSGSLDAKSLGNAQDLHKRQMEYAIFLSALFYFLQIVDANISAHLSEFDKDVSLMPTIIRENEIQSLGLVLKIKL
jgi:hypothetical protein